MVYEHVLRDLGVLEKLIHATNTKIPYSTQRTLADCVPGACYINKVESEIALGVFFRHAALYISDVSQVAASRRFLTHRVSVDGMQSVRRLVA